MSTNPGATTRTSARPRVACRAGRRASRPHHPTGRLLEQPARRVMARMALVAPVSRSGVEADVAQEGDTGRVAVVERGAGAGVQRGDPGGLLVVQRKVEDVEVLPHPLGPGGLGDDDDV